LFFVIIRYRDCPVVGPGYDLIHFFAIFASAGVPLSIAGALTDEVTVDPVGGG
jgi:hypothetical protein